MTAISDRTGQQVGLFLATYTVGGEALGAPLLELTITVDTPASSVAGISHVTQTTNPPLDVASRLHGDFTYLTVMPDRSSILVTATGYPLLNWPVHGGIGPVLQSNLDLRMVLEDGWQSGTASYRYQAPDGSWNSMTDQPARLVPNPTL